MFAVFALLDLITCLAQIFGNGFVLLIQHKRCHHLGNDDSGACRILGGQCLFQTRIAQGKYGNARIVECQIIAVRLHDADGNGSYRLHVVLFQLERTLGQPRNVVFLTVSLQCKAVAHDVFSKIRTLVAPSPQPSAVVEGVSADDLDVAEFGFVQQQNCRFQICLPCLHVADDIVQGKFFGNRHARHGAQHGFDIVHNIGV